MSEEKLPESPTMGPDAVRDLTNVAKEVVRDAAAEKTPKSPNRLKQWWRNLQNRPWFAQRPKPEEPIPAPDKLLPGHQGDFEPTPLVPQPKEP